MLKFFGREVKIGDIYDVKPAKEARVAATSGYDTPGWDDEMESVRRVKVVKIDENLNMVYAEDIHKPGEDSRWWYNEAMLEPPLAIINTSTVDETAAAKTKYVYTKFIDDVGYEHYYFNLTENEYQAITQFLKIIDEFHEIEYHKYEEPNFIEITQE